jgi:hypothetical protein
VTRRLAWVILILVGIGIGFLIGLLVLPLEEQDPGLGPTPSGRSGGTSVSAPLFAGQ